VGKSKEDDFFLNQDIYRDVKKGDTIFIDNGKIEGKIIKKSNGQIYIRIKTAQILKDRKGFNVPNRRLNVQQLSKNDLDSIRFAQKINADYIALSFTRDKNDILNLKNHLKGKKIGIIAKIENKEGVDNLDKFIDLVDGIMIARGDLGVELPFEDIPIIQKQILHKCNAKDKMDIVATQMMESMINNSTPTRAETSDVANAILDGANVLMLSGETAIGKYPVKVVEEMTKIALEVEPYVKNGNI
jgi:pyruvate kinase